MNFTGSQSYAPHKHWHLGSVVSSANGALGVTGRAAATVEALASTSCALIKPVDGTPCIELRFRGAANSGSNVWQLYCAAGQLGTGGIRSDDHYTLVSQITAAQGTQLYSGTIYFADDLTVASEGWLSDTVTVEPASAADQIARYVLNTHGYDRFALVLSTKTHNGYVDWREVV